MDIYVGQAGFRGDFVRYAQRHSFVELLAEPQRLPAVKKLKEWRKVAPDGFKFAVVVPPTVLESPQEGALAFVRKVLAAVEADVVILRTPTSLRPTPNASQRLQEMAAGFDGGTATIAWEPRGVWQAHLAMRVAEDGGFLLVQVVNDVRSAQTAYVRV